MTNQTPVIAEIRAQIAVNNEKIASISQASKYSEDSFSRRRDDDEIRRLQDANAELRKQILCRASWADLETDQERDARLLISMERNSTGAGKQDAIDYLKSRFRMANDYSATEKKYNATRKTLRSEIEKLRAEIARLTMPKQEEGHDN